MEYLKLTRGHITLACFLVVSVLLVKFPAIDLAISKLFFHGSFYLQRQWWPGALQAAVPYFLAASMTLVLGTYLVNRRSTRNIGAIDGRKVLYLFVVLLLGAGVIVNYALKDHFGRARPRDVTEFGGLRQFTPPFVISHQCDRNCSFPSGDAAAAFFSIALARALSRRRASFVTAICAGAVVSMSRVAVGAHFLSDVVTSFFVMWITADVLHHYMVLTTAERRSGPAPPARPCPAAESSA